VDQKGSEERASVDRRGFEGMPNQRGSEEGALMGRRDSGRKISKPFLGLCRAV